MRLLFTLFLLFSLNLYCQTTNRQVIIKFNYAYLDFNIVDNKDYFTFPVKQILKSSAKEYLLKMENEFPGFSDWELTKIFSLTTKDTVSISRLGDKVTIPPFWAVFTLNVLDDFSLQRILYKLNNSAPWIEYCHPNYFISTTSAPNDPNYVNQISLNSSPLMPNAGINIEQAWGIETGKSFVKVGIHDTGIDSTHEDLNLVFGHPYYADEYDLPDWGTDQEGHGTAVAGIVGAKTTNSIGIAGIAGGDSTQSSGVSLIDFKWPFLEQGQRVQHLMAGIVDAARSVGTYWTYPYSDYYEIYSGDSAAIHNDSTHFAKSPGFGIHIGNHSYMLKTELPALSPPGHVPGDNNDSTITIPSCSLCREAYLFSLKNGVINVVARGNSSNVFPETDPTYITDIYPQSLPDNWIISVGASGYDGNTIEEGINQSFYENYTNYYSLYGNGMDIIAPGSDSIIYTTQSTSNSQNTFPYCKFNGTSAAAPHVSGVVGLLLSHYNKECYNRRNLSFEDVDFILKKSATDLYNAGPDIKSGYGRLNAGRALQMIENPTKQIIHPDSLISSIEVSRDTIALGYNNAFVNDGWGPISRPFPLLIQREYKAIRVLMENTYSFDNYITPATQIIAFWSRPSVSNSTAYFNDTSQYIYVNSTGQSIATKFDYYDYTPYDTIYQFDIVNHTVKTRGYYYKFVEAYMDVTMNLGNNDATSDALIEDPTLTPNIWYPIDPFQDTAKMLFSIYIIDSTLTSIYDYPCDSLNTLFDQNLNIDDLNNFLGPKIYPNPTFDRITIELNSTLETDTHVTLFDFTGYDILKKEITSEKSILDMSHLPSGIYFIKYNSESLCKSYKVIKL